ncbi:CYTH domain-containing protein [Streptomyces parvus]|uniref:CYTH domain-containing protein n=1 Tax=Streptomyces parvus TaxID=66428 RepID=A0A7K3RWK4_9ACTN|nr:CYTH domain-containing protein [Streptomyces parvus]NEC19620.1 CYTH domain-containing protein [Streptomyces parvus]
MGTEIERKYLADRPHLEPFVPPGTNIMQGYITVSPQEVRLRREDGKCTLTVKSVSMLVRSEYEIELTDDQFEGLWPATHGNRVEKSRSTVDAQGHSASLDVYSGRLQGLRTIEVEFADINAAESFDPPPWFGPEVTYNESYKNRSLASLGSISALQDPGERHLRTSQP